MNEVEKVMAEFHRSVRERLPTVPVAKPFEVKVSVTQTETKEFPQDTFRPTTEDKPSAVFAPPKPTIVSITPTTGPATGGTSVTIQGTNFVSGATVNFGTVPGTSVVVVNSNTITCVTPKHDIGVAEVIVEVPPYGPNFQAHLASGFNFFLVQPDNYFWVSSGPPLTPWGFNYGDVKTFQIQAFLGGRFYTEYQGKVNVSVTFIDPRASFNDNPDINFPINVLNGVAVLQIQAFLNDPGPSTTGSITFLARDAQYPSAQGDRDMAIGSGTGSVGRKTGGGGGGGIDHFTWGGTVPPGHFSVFSWLPGDVPHSLTIKRMTADGNINTTYNGTAVITVQIVTPAPPSGAGFGVSVSIPHSVTFVNGVANLTASASYDYHDITNSQGYGYFNLIATDGSVTNSVQGNALNHT